MNTKTLKLSNGDVVTYATVLTRAEFKKMSIKTFPDQEVKEDRVVGVEQTLAYQDNQILALCKTVKPENGEEFPFTAEYLDGISTLDFASLNKEVSLIINGKDLEKKDLSPESKE